MIYTRDLISFVEGWEGFKAEPSGDPLVPGVRDIGFGHVLHQGQDFGPITREQAEAVLRNDLDYVAAHVSSMVKVPLAQYQFDALCAFAFNVGLDLNGDGIAQGLGDSTLLKLVNEAHFDKAALQFTLWCHADGKTVDGLVKRRVAEQAMFNRGDYSVRP